MPGVLAAVLIRVWLTVCLPDGIYHFDTLDFLQTPFDLLSGHRLTVHGKKTFLAPFLFTVPFLFHVPALVVIPLGQHFLGCLLVLMTGALCRLWFVFWQYWIVPLTLLMAVHPSLLWFEHTLLAEADYVFGVVWLALAGTLFVRWPGWNAFGFLLAALFFTAGARPEGRLFLAFGVLLTVVVYRRAWRAEIAKFATLAAFCVAVLLLTRTTQSGTLLYASLIHLAPDRSRIAPDLLPCIATLRDDARRTRAVGLPNDIVAVEKQIVEQFTSCYAPLHPEAGFGEGSKSRLRHINGLCLRLALEITRAHPWELGLIVADRFLARINDDTGGEFLNHDLQTRQYRSIIRGAARNAFLGPGLAGIPLQSETQVAAFIYAHYDERRVGWYNAWEHAWMAAIGYFHLPDRPYSAQSVLPGLPYFYVLAAVGAVLSLLLGPVGRAFHWTFLPVLAGVWFTVTLTGALMPRYRFVLEPFWLLYLFYIPEAVARLTQMCIRRL